MPNSESSTVQATPTILDNLVVDRLRSSPYVWGYWMPMPWEDYDLLMAAYPSVETVVGTRKYEQNARYDLDAVELLAMPEIDPIMKDFIEVHTSNLFWQVIVDKLGGHIRAIHPDLEERVGKDLCEFTVGVRNAKREEPVDIELDAKPGYNTPVTRKGSVRGPHVDNPRELFAAIMYCRERGDTSRGGDLIINKVKPGRPSKMWKWHGKNELFPDQFRMHEAVPYHNNVAVMFINELYAVHSVTPREETEHPRRLMNFIAELRQSLFTIPKERHKIR